MTDAISRHELDAKIDAIEARADARLSRFEERIDQAISAMKQDRQDLKSDITDLKKGYESSASSLRTTMIVTGLSTAVAIVLGVGAFNATVLSNMVASFESGKNTSVAITQASEQLKQTQEQLKEMQETVRKEQEAVLKQQEIKR